MFVYNGFMPERRLTLLYSADIFTGSLLLFWVQPLLGGAPAVWTTAQVFFQLLLAGYLYAHALNQRLAPRRQAVIHLAVLAAACAWLWLPLPESAPPGTLIGKSICPMCQLYLRENRISNASRETYMEKVRANSHPLCKS